MTTKLMSEDRQFELVSGVKKASDYVCDGMTPTQAIIKAAGEINANPHELQRMVEAYNTAATLAHMKVSDDKSASFPLANYDEARQALFPNDETIKKSSAASLASLTSMAIPDLRYASEGPSRKTAAERPDMSIFFIPSPSVPRDWDSYQSHVIRQCEHWKTEARKHEQAANEYRKIARQALEDLVEMFRSVDRPDWHQFVKEARSVHGPDIDVYVNEIYAFGRLRHIIPPAPAKTASVAYVDTSRKEHKLLEVMKLACELAASEMSIAEQYRRRYDHDRRAALSVKIANREDFFTSDILDRLESIFNLPKKLDELEVEDDVPKGFDISPEVGMESRYLNRARAQFLVRRVVDNDPVIKQHFKENPHKVLQAFDEVIRVSPRSISKPAVVQAGVRKILELGLADPYEMKTIQSVGENQPGIRDAASSKG